MKYTDSDEYQAEISEQYKKRTPKFTGQKIVKILDELGFENVKNVKKANVGNVNATFITDELVVKIKSNQEHPFFLANKIVSDKLANRYPVVKVLAYDFYDKTEYEVLVMERTKGDILIDTIFELTQKDVIKIFKQTIEVVKQLFNIKFNDFGWINIEPGAPSYTQFLKETFDENAQTIEKQSLCAQADLKRIKDYFFRHLSIFKNEEAVLVHTDFHMGNILHQGNKLTALIDFDWAEKAAKVRSLNSILGFICNPQQFTEGTDYFPKYKGKNFVFLLPILKQELNFLFEDKDLLQKLNLLFIAEGIKWIAENWSEEWNKEMIKIILDNELPLTKAELKNTYFGKILSQ